MRERTIMNTRPALLIGFGGVLALMFFAGLDAARVIGRIHTRDKEIRRDYQSRNLILNQIRSNLYLSGTYVRDYLLEPEATGAATFLSDLEATRRRMDAALGEYESILRPNERRPFDGLKRELRSYWKVLDPVLRWTSEQRRKNGYQFLRDEVFPRRMAMLDVAGQIAAINDKLLAAGEESAENLFSEYRQRLVFTLLVSMGLGISLAAFSIHRTLHLELEAADRYQEIVEARRELKNLSASLVAAQENERRSISRELHDEVGQSLSAVLVELGNLAAALPDGSGQKARQHADTIRKLVEGSVAAVRNLALLLRPSMLDDLSLVPALQWQARETGRRTGIRVAVAADSVLGDLPESHKTCVYRLVQEALHNCTRHAEARKIQVTVRQEGDRLVLTVQDDGKGFDPKKEKGLGILGMEERVTHLNGSFRIDSQPGQGSLIAVTLPLAGSPGPEEEVD